MKLSKKKVGQWPVGTDGLRMTRFIRGASNFSLWPCPPPLQSHHSTVLKLGALSCLHCLFLLPYLTCLRIFNTSRKKLDRLDQISTVLCSSFLEKIAMAMAIIRSLRGCQKPRFKFDLQRSAVGSDWRYWMLYYLGNTIPESNSSRPLSPSQAKQYSNACSCFGIITSFSAGVFS